MDQVLVLTYTDRNHKTRIVSEFEFLEMFVCENSRGRILNDEEEWLELFNGDFNYISFYQAVINGDLNDFQATQEELNDHWTTRGENGVNGVYSFVNAGVLDHKLFNSSTFETKEPTDFQMWMFARKHNYDPMNPLARPSPPPQAPVEKTSTKKPWVL